MLAIIIVIALAYVAFHLGHAHANYRHGPPQQPQKLHRDLLGSQSGARTRQSPCALKDLSY